MAYQDGHMPTSAIKYIQRTGTQPRQTGTQRLSAQPTQGQQIYGVLDDIQYNPVPPRRRGASRGMITPEQQPRQWATDDDPNLRPLARRTTPQQQPPSTRLPAQPKTISRRTLFLGGASLVLVCVVGTEAISDKVRDLGLQLAQGPEPVRNIELYCGHGEKSGGPPTWLHVFIHAHQLTVIEYPGGNRSKPHETVLDGLPVTGDISQWDLEVVKQQVDGGKWQIQLSVQGPGFLTRWLLVDAGQYFRAVNPK